MFLNNRYHDPTLGTFISVDPLVQTTGEAYIYASGNPTTLSDPTGLDPDTSARDRGRAEAAGGCTYSSVRSCWDRVTGDRPGGLLGALAYARSRQGYDMALAKAAPVVPGTNTPDETPLVLTPEQQAAIDAYIGGLTLTPGVPPKPDDPLGAALWEYLYGARRGDADVAAVLADAFGAISDGAGGVALGCTVASPVTGGASMSCAAPFGAISLGAGGAEAVAAWLDQDEDALCMSTTTFISAATPVPADAPLVAHAVHGTFTLVVSESC